MKRAPAVVTDLEQLPLVLTMIEIARIYRISTATIRRRLQQGTFRPQPFETYPYRWRRLDVASDLQRKRDDQERRNHGGRLRPARATLPKSAALRSTAR